MALHMINWTIGQLGLGEVQVLGIVPQGMDKDKQRFARMEDLCLCLCYQDFVLTLSKPYFPLN